MFYSLQPISIDTLKGCFFTYVPINSLVFHKSDLIWYINWTAIYAVAFFGDRFRVDEIEKKSPAYVFLARDNRD